jgi:protein involved in polysaccharide export with SLBB domain
MERATVKQVFERSAEKRDYRLESDEGCIFSVVNCDFGKGADGEKVPFEPGDKVVIDMSEGPPVRFMELVRN